MQIIILTKTGSKTLAVKKWMYAAAIAAGSLTIISPAASYWVAANVQQSTQNIAGQDLHLALNEVLTKKVGQMQAQVLYLDQLLLTVKDKLNITEIKPYHYNNKNNQNNNEHNHSNHSNNDNYNKSDGKNQGGPILLTELDYPLQTKTSADPAFAILDGMDESQIKGLIAQHQAKTNNLPKSSTFAAISGLLNKLSNLSEKVQNYTQEANSIDNLLAFQNSNKQAIKFKTMPVRSANLTSGFGLRSDPFHGTKTMHAGQDFGGPIGTPIYAVKAGVVVASEYHPQYGNLLDIDHGNGLKTRYAHNSELLVRVGQIVKEGAMVAKMGSTGRSTGSHLHFEVRLNNVPYNPTLFMGGSTVVTR